MLFLKYISDVWQDHYDEYKEQYGDAPELIEAMMANERFVLPKSASFYALYERRHEPGNGERIDRALHAIEEANGQTERRREKRVPGIFRLTLTVWVKKNRRTPSCVSCWKTLPVNLNLKPSRVGTLDVIGNAYEYLIKNFAASGGQKTENSIPAGSLSDLIAELLDPQPGDTICDPACGSRFVVNEVRA